MPPDNFIPEKYDLVLFGLVGLTVYQLLSRHINPLWCI